jgi:hypothetical protein
VHGQPGRLLIKCSVIRKYDLTVSRGTAAPDGYLKKFSPHQRTISWASAWSELAGTPRDSNWRSFLTSYRGDTIQVTLHNQITGPQEGVALHWHGILQKSTPSVLVRPGNHFLPTNFRNRWMDGVPAISQCPIPYGQSFTYSFIADLYGSSWYHSHYSAQYSGGLFGPMIIHGPPTLPYDIGM